MSSLTNPLGASLKSVEPGAPAGKGYIPLSVPHLAGNEAKYLQECLDTNWVSSAGPFVQRFERMVAEYVGCRHAVATVNGTAALHVALMLAGAETDDEVVVSDLTFIAPANAVRYLQAWPVFIDAEPQYWQMDAAKLADFLGKDCIAEKAGLRNRRTGRLVKAILPVHILGGICEMDAIVELGRRYGLPVIEDASECLGASWRERKAGTWGQLGCLSFNGNKTITTGGGGMIVTDDDRLASRARYLTTQAKDDPVEFVHKEVGYNYRLPNLLAAIGCAQMEQLEGFIARKRAIAEAYTTELEGLPGVSALKERPGAVSTFWLFTIRLREGESRMSSRELIATLEAGGVQSRPLWQPMHRSPAHAGACATDCTVAERLNRECVSLPSSVGLRDEELHRVCRIVKQALGQAPS